MAKWSNEKMADLTRKLADTAIDCKKRCEELEAKLAECEAKLAEAEDFVRRTIRYAGNIGDDFLADKARATLAELTGGKDE